MLTACQRPVTTSYVYPRDLDHPDYVKRSKAVRDFLLLRDTEQMPGAFALLNDREAHIRVMAYDAIRNMSRDQRDFGYRPYLEEQTRRGIVERWRAWYEAGQPASGEGPAAAASGANSAGTPDNGLATDGLAFGSGAGAAVSAAPMSNSESGR